jgi:hypothetical protein
MNTRPARAAHWEVGETLADRFRAHASDSRHLYGYAMRGMAEDWEAGGPTRIACRGYENAPRGAMIQFRLLAGVFRLVLTGEAPELLRFYPCLGGTEPARRAWSAPHTITASLSGLSRSRGAIRRVSRRGRWSPPDVQEDSLKTDASSSDTPNRPASLGTSVSFRGNH